MVPMPEPLDTALAQLQAVLEEPYRLRRAIASGKRHGNGNRPEYRRVTIRPVSVKGRLLLQVTREGERSAPTANYEPGVAANTVISELLNQPYGNWHVETVDSTYQLRVTKRGQAQLHRVFHQQRSGDEQQHRHDRQKQRLIAPGDPLFTVLGADGDKRKQVDAFLRIMHPAVTELIEAAPSGGVLRVVDLGAGNAYLTFAAHRYLMTLAEQRGITVTTVGVEQRPELVTQATERAREAGLSGLSFVEATIAEASIDRADIVLALHACDTATDEALARAVEWKAPVIVAVPCCHRDIQRQLRSASTLPEPYPAMLRHAILRERFSDVLTDTFRSLLLRTREYRVDVVEFIDSRHTPRNALIRAVKARQGIPAKDLHTAQRQYDQLREEWSVVPALERLLFSPES